MNNKNKLGFTLVELLAVIVILAVVILIAVTAVIPRMNKAKKKAFLDEALIYMNSISDVAVIGNETECFNISDLEEYVKQTKAGYSGALYINEDGKKTINITNGTYYLISTGKPTEFDISDTEPTKFVSSCTDTSKPYTITYDLGGGTLESANPTSYTANTATFTLNNPTKSGYKFVGWSSKNVFDKNKYLYMSDFPNSGESSYKYNTLTLKPNTNYFVSIIRYNNFDGKAPCILLITQTGDDGLLGLNSKWTAINHMSSPNRSRVNFQYTTSSNGKLYIAHSWHTTQEMLDLIWANTDVQLEEGTFATDYQEYMAPTANAKVYRGSTGNKKFVANWEAL